MVFQGTNLQCKLCRTLPPGVEFVLHDMQEPHLYIICKQQRKSPKETEPLVFYDILDGRIYQMPALHAAISSRMVSPLLPQSLALHVILTL